MAKKNVNMIVDALNALDASPDVYVDADEREIVVTRKPGIKTLGRIDCVVNYAGWAVRC